MIVLMSTIYVAIARYLIVIIFQGKNLQKLKNRIFVFVARLQSFANLGKVIPQLLVAQSTMLVDDT